MSGSIVYVSNAESGTISVFALDAAGTLTLRQRVTASGVVMPLALAPHGAPRFLYAALRDAPLRLLAYAIDPLDGTLHEAGVAPLPASMAYVSTDPAGTLWMAASYGDALIAVGAIESDGRPRPAHQVLRTAPKAHSVRSDAAGRFAYAAVLGSDEVLQFRLDAATKTLVPLEPPALRLRAGCGPRHIAFHPRLARLYVLSELDGALDVLAIDGERGTLAPLQSVSTLPPGLRGEPWCAELRITPDGAFVYTSERRSSTIAGFVVDPADGRVMPVAGASRHWPTQAQPRGMAIDPSGRFLVVAGQRSHRVGVHRIDPASGALDAVCERPTGLNPNWIETIAR